MKIAVIAYFEDAPVELSMSKVKTVIPKPLKIKIIESEEVSHVFEVKRIIKVDSLAAVKTKFFQYEIEIEDDGVLKKIQLRYYPMELLWTLAD